MDEGRTGKVRYMGVAAPIRGRKRARLVVTEIRAAEISLSAVKGTAIFYEFEKRARAGEDLIRFGQRTR